jgi:hypothetical protein
MVVPTPEWELPPGAHVFVHPQQFEHHWESIFMLERSLRPSHVIVVLRIPETLNQHLSTCIGCYALQFAP